MKEEKVNVFAGKIDQNATVSQISEMVKQLGYELSDEDLGKVYDEFKRVTGKKDSRKEYQKYTGYRSGLKITTPEKLRESDPARIIKSAVWGMLPHGRLGRAQFRKLRVYAGPDYPQVAQKPVKVSMEK